MPNTQTPDFYDVESLLTDDERHVRDTTARFVDDRLLPIIVDCFDQGRFPMELVPEFFERYFAFFRPGHQEGVVTSRLKELARLKIAALNACDT